MIKSTFLGALLAASLVGTGARAAEEAVSGAAHPGPTDGYKVLVVGAQLRQGEASTATSYAREREKPRWSYGALAYVDYYLTEMLALETGVGVVRKGHRFAHESDGSRPFKPFENYQYSTLYIEVPLGVRLNVASFRIGLFGVVDVGLSGTVAGVKDQDADEFDVEWSNGDESGRAHRFNVAPKVSLGYAFHTAAGYVVPSIEWSMDLLEDSVRGDENRSFRNMNAMFGIALEYGI